MPKVVGSLLRESDSADAFAAGGGGGGNPTLTNTEPATPAANTVALYARSYGRMLPGGKGPGGDTFVLQPHFGRNRINIWAANGNTAVVSLMGGLLAPTVVGTAAVAIAVAATNVATRVRRIAYLTTAIAGVLSGAWFANQLFWTTGNGGAGVAAMGGFHVSFDFVPSFPTVIAGARYFVGMSNLNAAPTNVEPSTLTNCVGVGKVSTSNNLCIVGAGSAAQAVIDLGVNFPAATNRVDLYRVSFYASPAQNGVINYRVERVNTGDVATGTLTPTVVGTQTPASTVFMQPRWWSTNNATASIVGLDMGLMYIESDN